MSHTCNNGFTPDLVNTIGSYIMLEPWFNLGSDANYMFIPCYHYALKMNEFIKSFPKMMWNCVRLHGVTAKKTAIFEVLKYFLVVQTTEQASLLAPF